MSGKDDFSGGITSPGGFVFGIQGFVYSEQKPTSITFFLGCGLAECCTKVEVGQVCTHTGRVRVCDQYGRPMKGTMSADSKPTMFETCSHLEAIKALAAERIDFTKLAWAGWPQLPYDMLKELPNPPMTPLAELQKIRDPEMRKAAIRLRLEMDQVRKKELEVALEVEPTVAQ